MVAIPKLGMPAVAAFSYLIRYNIYTLVFVVYAIVKDIFDKCQFLRDL